MRFGLKTTAVLVMCAVGVPVAMLGTALATFLYLPLPAAVPTAKYSPAPLVSYIYAADGTQIGQFSGSSVTIPVADSAIPAIVKDAVVASEDRNFYHEGGISVRGTLRALWADVTNHAVIQGGSTITQQYVKHAYTSGSRTLARKVKEAILASELSRSVSKDQILYDYLSTTYFGEGAYGIGAAAAIYFRTTPSKLSVSQAAMLSGLIPAPSVYDPLVNSDLAETRRQQVLGLMLDQRYIDQATYNLALSQHVVVAGQPGAGLGATVVFAPQAAQPRFPYFVDYVRRFLATKLTDQQLTEGGLRIQTTLDPTMQSEAEASVAKSLSGTKAPLDMALVSVEPSTGYVKALVGGRDFSSSQVNLALGGCPVQPTSPNIHVDVAATCWSGGTVSGGGGGRQPGSAFKPFVLATALNQGISPQTVYPAPTVFRVPGCVGGDAKGCLIHNAEGGGGGSSTLRNATVQSINTVYAQVVRQVGCPNAGAMAKLLGITSAWYSPQVQTCSGNYALGVIGVSPLDMASAYSTFADQGDRIQPSPVVRVTDSHGKVIFDDTHPHGTQVISRAVADNVTNILQGVIQNGTGYPNAVLGRPAAGKTGTTDSFHDAWFVGYTPALSTSVWMGYSDSESRPLVGIKGVAKVFGGTIPAATWHDFMAQALKKVPVTDFSQPPPLTVPPAALALQQRQGFNPGLRQKPDPIPSRGPFIVPPPPPRAVAPTTTTTTTTPTTTSPPTTTPTTTPTSTTNPGFFG